MTLGTQTDAERAVAHFDSGIETNLIGFGAFRCVYRFGDVVYKVTSEAQNWNNERELSMYDCIDTTEWPEWLKIPRMTGYSVGDRIIVAAEYVPGILSLLCEVCSDFGTDVCEDDDCIGWYRRNVVFGLMFTDAECYGNTVQHVDGSLYIVDLPD